MDKLVVDKARLLKRVIIISWIALGLCFVIKIFGGNFFEIMCDSPNYKALCDYADNNFWLKFIITVISSLYCETLYVLSILQKYKLNKKEFFIIFISIILSCYFRLTIPIIGSIFDLWIFFIMPIILLGKQYKKYWQVILAAIITLAFQIISLFVKNLTIGIIDDSTFISLIYGIDVYLMCLLYYLYRNFEKEKKKMGAFWGFFMGKPVDKLKEMKAKREKQIAKLNEEIKTIDAEIAKQSKSK